MWHGRAAWHGGTVLLLCSSGLALPVLCCFWCFYILAFWDVFGCDVGHLKALALIPIDVYVRGGSEPNQTQINPNKN